MPIQRLQAQIRSLDEQLQRLVRTEQRLYYSQRELGRQLGRVEALNRFSIVWAGCRSEAEILRKLVSTLFSLFPYDQAVAFLRGADGRFSPVIGESVRGREFVPPATSPTRRGLLEEEIPREVKVVGSAEAAPPTEDGLRLRALVAGIFGEESSDGPLWFLFLPLGEAEAPLGFLVLRRQGQLGFHEVVATEADRPMLELFGRHASMALTQFRLVEDLRLKCAQLAEAQHEQVERERLAALGELAAVVAHEVRNPLAVIFNSLAGLRRAIPPAGQPGELLAVMGEEAERLDRMVSDLIDFARPNPPQLKAERLEAIVEHAVERVLQAWPASAAQIRIDVDADTPAVLGDARMLHQAVVNLLTNSLQAERNGAPIHVRLQVDRRESPPRVKLDVVDHGEGIPPRDLDRIFEPFYTTRATGTGLGLAVVRKVVQAHRGELLVRSSPGEGTAFSLLLPTAPPEPV